MNTCLADECHDKRFMYEYKSKREAAECAKICHEQLMDGAISLDNDGIKTCMEKQGCVIYDRALLTKRTAAQCAVECEGQMLAGEIEPSEIQTCMSRLDCHIAGKRFLSKRQSVGASLSEGDHAMWTHVFSLCGIGK